MPNPQNKFLGFLFLGGQLILSLLFGMFLIYWNRLGVSSIQDELLVFLLPPVFYTAYQYPSKRLYIPSLSIGIAISTYALWNMNLSFGDSMKTLAIVALSTFISAEWVYWMNQKRHEVECELAKNQAQLRAIFDGVSDAIYTKDRNGCIRTANRACETILGLPLESILGKTAYDLFDLPTAATIYQRDREIWQGKSACQEYAICVKDREFILQFTKVPLRDENGQVAGICEIARDVTEAKKVEREREALIAELQQAVGNIRQLSGLLPVCSSCKKIRNDKGYWMQVEEYIHAHSDAQITHGLCPDCAKKYFPDDYGDE